MGDECPNCVGGELFWSDQYQSWQCDECGTLVSIDLVSIDLVVEEGGRR